MRRFVVGVAAAVVLACVGLVAAGSTGAGPLGRFLGVTVSHVEPVGFSRASGDPTVLIVVVDWPHDGFCSGQFTATAQESDRQVRLDEVVSREYRGGACAGLGTVNGQAGVNLTLEAPLGDRAVVRAVDGQPLPEVTVGSRAG